MLATRAADASCALVYVNLVGGQDELVFDGASLVVDAEGGLVARGPQFAEAVMVVDVDVRPVFRKRLLDPRGRAVAPALEAVTVTDRSDERDDDAEPGLAEPFDPVREVYEALVLGTRDYVTKNGFSDVVIGLSGGIDSSLAAILAVDALGAEHVHGVAMPSRFSSAGSNDDAKEMADQLGIDFRVIAIEAAHAALLDMLDPSFAGTDEGLAEENVQARVRGVVLMALSNKFGWMVLATGNKSEMAAGFATLYGDMAGGFAVIKDVPKTLVYDLCRDRNARGGDRPPIPESVLDKPPSAELRADQRDDQSLPAYDELDPVLEAYIEGDMTAVDLEGAGFDGELVRRVVALVDKAEYKRRQAPPGVRVTPKAFGKDRRLPITNHYR
jgi:NAD+ synthase (glutamine-hydrolysing)